MIPNIFVSSTIKDLRYLRDALRDTIIELAYNPVMSEHSGVGYLNPMTAAQSCYLSVTQCQMVVLIIGNRYGGKGDGKFSVTHQEFYAARDANIPIITLVESKVLNYKEVYDSNPNSEIWDDFNEMDYPVATFEFLNEISNLKSFNATVPFTTPSDAKQILKSQLAHFVGDRLNGTIPLMTENVREILAEITTLRTQLTETSPELKLKSMETQKYLIANRFLLRDENSTYSHLLDYMTKGDLSNEMGLIISSASFNEIAQKLGYTLELVTPAKMKDFIEESRRDKSKKMIYNSSGGGRVLIFRDNRIAINVERLNLFNKIQKKLCETVNGTID